MLNGAPWLNKVLILLKLELHRINYLNYRGHRPVNFFLPIASFLSANQLEEIPHGALYIVTISEQCTSEVFIQGNFLSTSIASYDVFPRACAEL